MKTTIFFITTLLFSGFVSAQFGIGTLTPKAMLDIQNPPGQNYGIQIPIVDDIQNLTDLEGNPAPAGTLAFDTSRQQICFCYGSGQIACFGDDGSGNGGVNLIDPTPPGAFTFRINEFHYTNTGGDTNEFIEVRIDGDAASQPSPILLSEISVALYNGSTNSQYDIQTLNNFTRACDATHCYYVWTPSSIQNGDPDGIAIVGNGTTEFISYEGSFTATDGIANGETSTDVGVFEDGTSQPTTGSIQRSDDGTAWYVSTTNTSGAVNAPTFPPTTVEFTSATFSANEGDGTVDLTFSITNPSPLTATTFDVELSTGDAADINSYTTQTVTFAAGSSTNETLTITITDDSDVEASEDLTFGMTSVSGGSNASVGTISSATLTISDNDVPPNTTVEFTSTSATVDEDAGTIQIPISVTNPSPTVATQVDLLLIGTSTTTNGTDYDNGIGANVPFPVSLSISASSTSFNFPITILDDADIDPDETIVLTLSNPSGGDAATLGTNTTYTLTITDNDAPAVPILIFSEYLEGSSSNKYIEITNVGTGTATLSDYTVKLYANGSTTAGNTSNLNTVTGLTDLLAGESVVLKNSSASLSLPMGVTAYNASVCNFNGDDALTLEDGISTVIDVIGEVGTDPGSSWTVSGDTGATQNDGIRRNGTVTSGNTDWTASSASEWTVVGAQDDASNLGTF